MHPMRFASCVHPERFGAGRDKGILTAASPKGRSTVPRSLGSRGLSMRSVRTTRGRLVTDVAGSGVRRHVCRKTRGGGGQPKSAGGLRLRELP